MGRGARKMTRWKNDRVRKKKEREKRQAQTRGEERKATVAPT